jgi:DNA repair exonuclease SbcCD ATPase subunit
MIIFKTLAWKNFLSTGNNFTKVDFTAHKSTLVIGHNGAGKSTMLDALSFALFGKAHRNISKPQLVNSINNKDSMVEVEFTVHGSDYLIRRGIKPNIFEIMHNGELIDQSSHAKDYQKILEQNILKLNHKSFHQIVVLGSSSFIPFMQLSSPNRRDVIEDLLDINVFSKMNGLLKTKHSTLKDQMKDVAHQSTVNQTQLEAQKKYIKDIKSINKEQKEAKLELIADCQNEIKTLNGKNTELSDSIQQYLPFADEEKAKREGEIKSLEKYKTKFGTEIKKLVKEVQFFETNDICPTCTQPITEDTKKDHVFKGKERAKELQTASSKADEELLSAQSALVSAAQIIETCRQKQNELAVNNQSISQFQSSIDRTQKEIGKLDHNIYMDEANGELTALSDNRDSLVEEKLILNEQSNYNIVIGEMLKDTGIKTKIVKEYLPVINMLVNRYLQTLDFFVSFNLDESFQETIRSRHRDNFSYQSFSEGEKSRIDLSLLFTWRHIAKMKNSVATNLLILDETFDSSLDHEGVDNLMKIIYSLDNDTNVFVISHKGEMMENRFENKIEIYKDKNFSKIKEIL